MSRRPPPVLYAAFDTAAADVRDEALLPGDRTGGLQHFYRLLGRYDAAVRSGDAVEVATFEDEAYRLARRMHRADPTLLTPGDGPGSWLQRLSASPRGTVPLWGQAGDFATTVTFPAASGPGAVRVRFTCTGLFGDHDVAAHAVDWDLPWLTDTGHYHFPRTVPPAMPVHQHVRELAQAFLLHHRRNRLIHIAQEWRR